MLSPAISNRVNPSARPLSKERLACLVEVGMTHYSNSRLQEAREVFANICTLAPLEPRGEIGLGLTCFADGQFCAAAYHYRRALKLNPVDAYAYALLGEAQIFAGDLSTARISLRRACELDPKGAYGRLAQHLANFMQCLPAGYLKMTESAV